MAYMMKQLSENLATHMRWTVCAIGSTTKYARAAEYDDPRQRQHIGRWKSNLSGLAPDLLQPSCKSLKLHGFATVQRRWLRSFINCAVRWTQASGRAMKLFAVLPQANIQMSAIKLDSKVIECLAKLAHVADAWSLFFKVDKLNKLRKNAKFGLIIAAWPL
jgi:hypothetical protein